MLSTPTGKPGVVDTYTSIPREVFYGNRQFAQFWPYPATVDGTNSSNALNSPYTWQLWGGQLMGQETGSLLAGGAVGKWRTSIIGLTTAAYTSGATSLTVSTATAAEVSRLLGLNNNSIGLTITGAPTATGTVAAIATTCTAASGTTLTITNLAANVVTGSLVQPGDGSQTITSIMCVQDGLQVIDAVFTTRLDVYCPQLFSGGGTINTGMLVNYPPAANTTLITYILAALRVNTSGASFYP